MSDTFKKVQDKLGLKPDGIFGQKSFSAISKKLGITNKNHAVHFFAQCGHETAGFKLFEENLNYSEKALLYVFGKYFNPSTAKEFQRKPEKIANIVYSNRMGNGDEKSGDGFNYRGRGALQLTGKDNYRSFAKYADDMSIIDNPDKLLSVDFVFMSAMYFFDANKLWGLCEDLSDKSIEKLTERINGGYNGLQHRIELTKKYSHYTL